MFDKQALDGTCLSVTYHTILTEELNTITNLYANEETKKHMLGGTGFQTLNIVETPADTTKNQFDDQGEYPVHYGSNNNPSHNKSKQKPQSSNPSKITILKRDQSGNDGKVQNLNLPCMLCKNPTHPAHCCLQTRQLRDKKRLVPPNFCETHCGRINALCNKKACAIITTKNGKCLN